MTKIKKILAGTLAVMMAATSLTACGSDDSSSGSSAGNNSGSGDGSSSQVEIPAADTLVNTGKVVNIWCWNTEFRERFEQFYEPNKDASLWEGVEVNWIQHGNTDGLYQSMLDEAIAKQNDAEADDKIDIFLVEADYALKYVNADITLDVRGEVGISDDDMKDQYAYTQDIMTDSNGLLKGLSWQAAPGCFMYNATYARDVLGTDDPTEVQEYVKDWDAFTETAAKMKEAGVAMLSGYDDAYRVFSNNVSSPWVTDNTITIDPQISEWVEMTKEFSDNGYNNGTTLWDAAWKSGQKIDGKTFGYFFSTWGIAFTLLENTVDDKEGAMEAGNGGYGEWRACEGPQSYFWGGTWICGAYGSDNVAIIRDIMLKLTCDKDIMKSITADPKIQDYTNNKAAIQELCDEGYENPFLGGQNHLALLSDAAEKIDLSGKLSAYDQLCNEQFQAAMKDYFTGQSDYDTALAKFEETITTSYSTLTLAK